MAPGAVDQNIMDLFRIRLKGDIQAEIIFFRQRLQHTAGKTALLCAGLPARNRNRALINGAGRIRNHQFFRKLHPIAQPGTLRTGAERIIKGKTSGFDLINADAAVRTGEALTEGMNRLVFHVLHLQQSPGKLQNIFNGICQPLLNSRFDNQPVYNNSDIMLQVFVQTDFLRKLILAPIDQNTDITGALCLLQNFFVSPLPAPDHRRKKLNPASLRHSHNQIYHLVHRLTADHSSALRTVRNTHTGIQKPEIVIYFRHGTDRRPRITVCGLLINGNCGRKSLDALHIRFFHLTQKLPGVGREALHIPSLALRVNRVKGQRALPRSGKAGQHNQFISGNIQINMFQIIFSRAADTDKPARVFLSHQKLFFLLCHRTDNDLKIFLHDKIGEIQPALCQTQSAAALLQQSFALLLLQHRTIHVFQIPVKPFPEFP